VKGLGFGNIPKGLIPFHTLPPFILTPIQEQLLQGTLLKCRSLNFHFSVQEEFKYTIQNHLNLLDQVTGKSYSIHLSLQDTSTNAVAFLEDGSICYNDLETPLTRPSGHGALLKNLAETDGDILFVKNIDNVQHYSKSQATVETWELLGGILLEFRRECKLLFEKPEISKFVELNLKYQLFPITEVFDNFTHETLKNLLNRPIRVCGMVRNEGKPGGGPFWVTKNGVTRKQIIEKVQLKSTPEQLNLMVKSTHFNPVMIAVSPYSLDGLKFDLEDFVDKDAYFKVSKTHQGKKIGYIERPGLWNGAMADWNSIFVEIPSSVFSPVKNVLDLLDAAHRM
jgi:hypothetical protein